MAGILQQFAFNGKNVWQIKGANGKVELLAERPLKQNTQGGANAPQMRPASDFNFFLLEAYSKLTTNALGGNVVAFYSNNGTPTFIPADNHYVIKMFGRNAQGVEVKGATLIGWWRGQGGLPNTDNINNAYRYLFAIPKTYGAIDRITLTRPANAPITPANYYFGVKALNDPAGNLTYANPWKTLENGGLTYAPNPVGATRFWLLFN